MKKVIQNYFYLSNIVSCKLKRDLKLSPAREFSANCFDPNFTDTNNIILFSIIDRFFYTAKYHH